MWLLQAGVLQEAAGCSGSFWLGWLLGLEAPLRRQGGAACLACFVHCFFACFSLLHYVSHHHVHACVPNKTSLWTTHVSLLLTIALGDSASKLWVDNGLLCLALPCIAAVL